MLIHNKDDIEFVTEFPCLLGHPVFNLLIKSCAVCHTELCDNTAGTTVTSTLVLLLTSMRQTNSLKNKNIFFLLNIALQ